MKWVKGQSGNPRGRPPEPHDSLRKRIQAKGDEVLQILFDAVKDVDPNVRMFAIKHLVAYGYGSPEMDSKAAGQTVEMSPAQLDAAERALIPESN